MVQSVGNYGVLGAQNRLEQTGICVKTARIKDGVFETQKAGQACFQVLVNALGAADEPYGRHTIPIPFKRVLPRFDQIGIVGQAEVVVCAQVDHILARGQRDGACLFTGDHTFGFVKAGGLQAIKLGPEVFVEGRHDGFRISICTNVSRLWMGVQRFLVKDVLNGNTSQYMNVFMETTFTPFLSLGGGLLIGFAAVLSMALLGRIMGATGILAGFLAPSGFTDWSWRAAIVAGMVSGPLVVTLFTENALEISVPIETPMLIIGGFLVGIGVTFGGGCTSGHGVCGMARLSPRSIVATVTFMIVCFATVYVVRHAAGA